MKRWNRWKWFVMMAGISCVSIPVQATDSDHSADGNDMNEAVLQECQEWAAYFWQWYESGDIPPGSEAFEFSASVGNGMNPFLHSIVLFDELYADRLTPDYTIWQLIEDDSLAYVAFKIHSMTGMNIMRAGLEPKEKKRPELVPEQPLLKNCEGIEDDGLREFCEKLQEAFRSANFKKWCYQDDSRWPWGKPGFDCDDYADAMRWYLWHALSDEYPEIEVFTLALYYGRNGHAITALQLNGQYWFMDPQTGELYGPYASWEAMLGAVRKFMDDNEMRGWPRRVKKRTTPPWNEPSYWYTDPDRRQEVIDCFGWEDPELYWPPDFAPEE